MRRTHYTAEIRVLLCESCGAPLEAPVEGGAVSCSYCGAQSLVTVRDDRPAQAMPRASAAVDEATRLARLRQQDGKPFVPPESLRRLMSGSSFNPALVEEAFAIYQATRREVRATGSPEAAERLYFLTIIANNYYYEHDDHERRRAILETSLDTLFLPRHKQVVRCMLAGAAAKDGDLQAAEQWLAPCDPRSEDIESDSAYRNARAYVDTIKRDYRAVLEVLGREDDEVPISDARDAVCAVLRANAHERLGDTAAAVATLRARMGKENARGRLVMEQFVAKNSELSLCELSLPEAIRGHTEVAAKAAAGSSGGAVGSVLLVAGLGALVLGVVLAVTLPATSVADRIPPLIGPGIAGLVLIPLGLRFRNAAREAAYLRRHGILAQGVVVGIKATGTKINNVPLIEVQVTVKRPDVAPYQASFRQLMPPQMSAQMQAGVELPIRVHPQRPEKIMLELL